MERAKRRDQYFKQKFSKKLERETSLDISFRVKHCGKETISSHPNRSSAKLSKNKAREGCIKNLKRSKFKKLMINTNSTLLNQKECSSVSSNDVYKQKLTSEFGEVLIQLGLHDSSHATFFDLKDVLVGMKLIADLNFDCDKCQNVCSQVWKLLTADKHGVHRVSIRSVKMFVFGVCGIDLQTLFEISEFESTPSASTQESKSADDFVFTSTEHLSSVRSKFYEMILQKLTSTEGKDQVKQGSKNLSKERNLVYHNIKTEAKSQNDYDFNSNNQITQNCFKSSPNLTETNEISDHHNLTQQKINLFDPLKARTPVVSVNVHIGYGEIRSLDIYNPSSLYNEAKEFAIKNSLSENKLNILVKMLKKEIHNALTKIDEVDEEFDQ